MTEPNSAGKQKDPADLVCPALWRARKVAQKLAKSNDPDIDCSKFEEVSKELDALGSTVGCRYSRASETQERAESQQI